MTLLFQHYRPAGSTEVPVDINRIDETLAAAPGEYYLYTIEPHRHEETSEINSVKVEIIDNKPLFIPLGSSGPSYKIQFKTFEIRSYHTWYTVLGNDILKVLRSDYDEFPVGSYWNVDAISDQELPGSSFTKSDTLKGRQPIIFSFELQLSRSRTDAAGKTRPSIPEDYYAN